MGVKSVQLFGEVIGPGISGGEKSLHYGVRNEFAYCAFALKIDGEKVSYKVFKEYCNKFGIPTVPEIAVLPYDYETICEFAQGKSILAYRNGEDHIREGVVVTSYDEEDGQMVKFLNPEYLLMKESGKIVDFCDM